MVKDIKEVFGIMKDFVNGVKGSTKNLSAVFTPKRSLSRLATDGVANFSMIVEDIMSIDEGTLMARAMEKRFASFLMIVMSLNPSHDFGDSDSLKDYIAQFHQNINVTDDIVGNARFTYESIDPSKFYNMAESHGKEYDMFVNEAVLILHTIYEGINSAGINAEAAQINFAIEDVLEASPADNSTPIGPLVGTSSIGTADQRFGTMNNKFDKANNAMPTLLHIRVYDKNSMKSVDFIIGVHVTIHPVKQSDMILNIVRGLRNEDAFFNFIRWTTGETKFFKDLLFGLDQLKLDAVTNSASGNELFNIGRRKRSIAAIKNLFSKKSIMPNMSIVVTQETIDRIKSEYGYDMTRSSTQRMALIRKLMNDYFLLGFIINDQGMARVEILLDGQATFETYSYATLEKEQFVEDKQMKEIMKMLGRSV